MTGEDEGRAIFEQLRRADWIDGELDYETALARLAEGQTGGALAPPPVTDGGFGGRFIRWTPEDFDRIQRLTAIARAPYESVPWPDPPAIGLERLEADINATTDLDVELRAVWENYPDGAYWTVRLILADADRGRVALGDEGEASLAEAADGLCEHYLHEEVWGGWPLCPRHPTRPMWAAVGPDGRATWMCEADVADRAVIGQLPRFLQS